MSKASDGSNGSLNDALTTLADAADSFSNDLAELTGAVDDLEASAERWNVHRAEIPESDAAEWDGETTD